jgi:hypothetical protein
MTALAVPSQQGGITGWLLELVDTQGPVGVGMSNLLETVVPPGDLPVDERDQA